jgi:hypothetical protein
VSGGIAYHGKHHHLLKKHKAKHLKKVKHAAKKGKK